MTTPDPHDPRQASIAHLEIVERVIETIQDTYPAAATLDCHRQMRDVLTRIKNTLDHPVLFAAHIIVYLVKAARFSRRWATLVKNIPILDPSLLETHSSASSLKSQASSLTPSPASSPQTQDSGLQTQDSGLQTQDSLLSVPVRVRPCSSVSSLQPSSFRHSIETRLRIRAFAQALQHERHLAEKLPPGVPKPDLTPILPSRRHPLVLSSQPPASSLKTQVSRLQPPPPLFPSEAFWTSRVQSLQLRILANITRALDYISVAYLAQYDFPISSIPSIPSIPSTPSAPSTPSFPSHSSHPSHPSHSFLPSAPSTQSSALSSHSSPSQHSPLSPLSHPPPS